VAPAERRDHLNYLWKTLWKTVGTTLGTTPAAESGTKRGNRFPKHALTRGNHFGNHWEPVAAVSREPTVSLYGTRWFYTEPGTNRERSKMSARTREQTWVCPVCGYTQDQPAPVSAVAHACPSRGWRLVELTPEEDD
jgi:rubredoxin